MGRSQSPEMHCALSIKSRDYHELTALYCVDSFDGRPKHGMGSFEPYRPASTHRINNA